MGCGRSLLDGHTPDAAWLSECVSSAVPHDVPAELASAAATIFGDGLPLAREYAVRLATDGVVRGLIGPREAPRLWDRHLLNCGVLGSLVDKRAFVIDVGSGAGLPGVPLAIARPDVTIVLLEPLARRVAFLEQVVEELGLRDRVEVVRGRAEEIAARPAMFHVKPADIVTARAVAPLDRLAAWCLPLAAPRGRVLAIKGESAPEEIATHGAAIERRGGSAPVLRVCGDGLLPAPTNVVEIVRLSRATADRGFRSGRR